VNNEYELRFFHLSDLLSVATGDMLSTRGIAGIYDILNYMTDSDIYTHQIPQFLEKCAPDVIRQYPFLKEIDVSHIDEWNYEQSISALVEEYGEEFLLQKKVS
jgi:hypothetical protein